MGKILAYSGLMEDKEVTWMPSYGPEQRGGTANVTVILSDERISSPVLNAFDVAVILNQPSLEKFESKVKPGGILIYDGYGIHHPPTRTDINVYRINAMEAAKVRPGSEEGEVISTIAIASSSIVTTLVIALGVFGLGFLRPVLESLLNASLCLERDYAAAGPAFFWTALGELALETCRIPSWPRRLWRLWWCCSCLRPALAPAWACWCLWAH